MQNETELWSPLFGDDEQQLLAGEAPPVVPLRRKPAVLLSPTQEGLGGEGRGGPPPGDISRDPVGCCPLCKRLPSRPRYAAWMATPLASRSPDAGVAN